MTLIWSAQVTAGMGGMSGMGGSLAQLAQRESFCIFSTRRMYGGSYGPMGTNVGQVRGTVISG